MEALVGAMRNATEAARAGGEVTSSGVYSATEQMERMTRGFVDASVIYSRAMHSASQRFQSFVACSRAIADGMPRAQQAAMTWLGQSLQSNARFAQDLLRCRTLSDIAQVQGRLIEDTISGLLDGSAEVLRSAEGFLADAVEQIEGAGEPYTTAADVMTTDVHLVKPDDTVQKAARIMVEEDTGALPVGEHDKVVGMVTDRDIAVRVVAAGADPADMKVRDVMSSDVTTVREDEDVDRVVEIMAAEQVRRVPVVNDDEKLVGIISLGDVATEGAPDIGQRALAAVSQEGGRHQQDLSEAAANKPKRGRPSGRRSRR